MALYRQWKSTGGTPPLDPIYEQIKQLDELHGQIATLTLQLHHQKTTTTHMTSDMNTVTNSTNTMEESIQEIVDEIHTVLLPHNEEELVGHLKIKVNTILSIIKSQQQASENWKVNMIIYILCLLCLNNIY